MILETQGRGFLAGFDCAIVGLQKREYVVKFPENVTSERDILINQTPKKMGQLRIWVTLTLNIVYKKLSDLAKSV